MAAICAAKLFPPIGAAPCGGFSELSAWLSSGLSSSPCATWDITFIATTFGCNLEPGGTARTGTKEFSAISSFSLLISMSLSASYFRNSSRSSCFVSSFWSAFGSVCFSFSCARAFSCSIVFSNSTFFVRNSSSSYCWELALASSVSLSLWVSSNYYCVAESFFDCKSSCSVSSAIFYYASLNSCCFYYISKSFCFTCCCRSLTSFCCAVSSAFCSSATCWSCLSNSGYAVCSTASFVWSYCISIWFCRLSISCITESILS